MPPVELSGNTAENANGQPTGIVPTPAAFAPQSTRAKIGIIYPPPEVRSKDFDEMYLPLLLELILDIVDKTASFVARNGPSFESKVKEAESNNSKFNFLNPHDPYHAYYLHKVKEFMEGKAAMPGTTDQQQQAIAPTPSMQPAQKVISSIRQNRRICNDYFRDQQKDKVKWRDSSNRLSLKIHPVNMNL